MTISDFRPLNGVGLRISTFPASQAVCCSTSRLIISPFSRFGLFPSRLGLGDVFLLKDLLELEGNHALEGLRFHFGKDIFTGEEIAEVAATVGVLRCFCFHWRAES